VNAQLTLKRSYALATEQTHGHNRNTSSQKEDWERKKKRHKVLGIDEDGEQRGKTGTRESARAYPRRTVAVMRAPNCFTSAITKNSPAQPNDAKI
jgi:hypothetical protein